MSTSSRGQSRRDLIKIWLSYRVQIIGVVVVMALAAALSFGLERFADSRASGQLEQLSFEVDRFRKDFATGFRAFQDDVTRRLGLMNLPSLLQGEDTREIDAALEQFAAEDDRIRGARFLPFGYRGVDTVANPPLGYAVLEMLQRAEEKGDVLPPEVLFHGTDKQHLALLHAVPIDGQVIGHVFVAAKVDVVQATLDAVVSTIGNVSGYAEIFQVVAGAKPVVLAKTAASNPWPGVPSAQQPVRGLSWRVGYWASAPPAQQPRSMGMYVWPAAGVLALGLLLFPLLKKRRGEKQAAKAPVYGGAVTRVLVDKDDDEALGRFEGDSDAPVVDSRPPPPSPDEALQGLIVEESEGDVGELTDAAAFVSADSGPPPPPPPMDPPPMDPSDADELELPDLDEMEPDATPGMLIVDEEEPSAESDESADELPPLAAFRAYDIRGRVGELLNASHFRRLGHAIGSEADTRGQQTVVVGRDGRRSSPELQEALVEGIRAAGRDVIDIGIVPTPVLYFATFYLDTGSGVMVTGSHNGPEYNGLKIMLGSETLFDEELLALRDRLMTGDLASGSGGYQEMDLVAEYIRTVTEDVPVALGNAYKLVVDCGNGAAGVVAPKLFRALGHDVTELFCEVDGDFPNHGPDTSVDENLAQLIAKVREEDADLGFAFDGDGDRIAVIDGDGNIVRADRLMMLFARDILSRNPGANVIFDVKCTSRLGAIIAKLGGNPVMWKTGHSYMKKKLVETDAALAGELSGHIFIKDRWYGFDDALYAAARLLEILMGMNRSPAEIMQKLPAGLGTPELRVAIAPEQHARLSEGLAGTIDIPEATVTDIDGVRADFADGWGLVRTSKTDSLLVMRFEAKDQESLERIQDQFKNILLEIEPTLTLPI
ncbi:MAG: phosphomannomutase/phosphoglucomutase [Pseudomonadota bacterium]